MKILAYLRRENNGLAFALMSAGHDLWVFPDDVMLMQRKLGFPAQPLEGEEPSPKPAGITGMLEDYVGARWNNVSSMVRAVKALHAKEKLDAVVVWTDAGILQRAMVLAAKSCGIPTFELTHGALNTYRQGHFECESHVDYILAPGQEEADFRAFYGSKAEVIITGKPSFDWMWNDSRLKVRGFMRDKLGIPERRPVILYGMTWRHPFSTWERDVDRGEATVMEAHMNLQAVCKPFTIIKPHYISADDKFVKSVAAWCDANGVTDYAVTGMDVQALLPTVDLVVSHKSSLLVEAVLCDLPAVGFDFRERNDFDFYRGLGIEWVDRPADLSPAMARCLLDKDTRDRLAAERERGKAYFNDACDGRATERVIAAISQRAA